MLQNDKFKSVILVNTRVRIETITYSEVRPQSKPTAWFFEPVTYNLCDQ